MSGIPGFVTGGAVGFAKEWVPGAHAMWWGGAGTPTFLLGKGSPAQPSSGSSPCLSPYSVSRPVSGPLHLFFPHSQLYSGSAPM